MIELIWTLFGTFLALLTYAALKSHQSGEQYKKQGILYLGSSFFRALRASLKGQTALELYLETCRSIQNTQHKLGLINEFSKKNWIVTDLSLLRQIYVKDFDHFTDRMEIQVGNNDPITGKMLFALPASDWKPLRHAMSPGFSSGRMRRMFHKFDQSGRKMVQFLQAQIEEKSEDAEVEVNIRDALSKYTMDLIASVAYGIDSLAFDPKNLKQPSVFEEMGHKIQFKPDVSTIIKTMIRRFSPKFAERLGITPFCQKSIDFFWNVVKDVIQHRNSRGEEEPRQDFLQLMMDKKKGLKVKDEEIDEEGEDKDSFVISEDVSKKEKLDVNITIDDIAAQSLVLILGGYDTVMVLNQFAVYNLALYPDIQERLYEEVKEHLEQNGGQLTYDVLNGMEYLNMFVNETLRLHSPATFTERICTKAFKVPDSDVIINKGDHLTIPIFGVHKSQEYFPEPEVFNPDRFSKENRQNIVPYSYMPFGHGQRNCIAFRLGIAESKAVIAHLVMNFTIRPPLDYDPRGGQSPMDISPMGALVVTEKIRVTLTPRR